MATCSVGARNPGPQVSLGDPYLAGAGGMIWGQMRRRCVKMRSIYRIIKAGEMEEGV